MSAGGRRSAAFKRQVAGATDPYFSQVKFLYQFNGTNGSNTFTDVKGHTVATRFGSPVLSTADKYFGTASLSLNGSSAFDINGNDDEDLLTNDFAIEFIIKLTVPQVGIFILGTRTENTTANGIIIGTGFPAAGLPSGVLRAYAAGSERGSTTRIDDNQWRYLALVRSGGFFRGYVGTMNSSTAAREFNSAISGSISNYGGTTNRPRIGANEFAATSPTDFMTGYIDSMRITVGTDRGFTGTTIPIPTAPFPEA